MKYVDFEQKYVNKKILLTFYHVPSGNSVTFKGRVTKLSDRFSSAWNAEEVYGRNDPIPSFKGTKRQISIAWQVIAANLEEAKENLSLISLLMTFLYPSYSSVDGGASTIAASPLLKMKFTNLVANSQDGSGLLGFVDGFSYEPIFEDEFYDPEPGKLYPQGVDLSCNFTVLHTHPLGWGVDKGVRSGNNFPYGSSIVGAGYKTVSPTSEQTLDNVAESYYNEFEDSRRTSNNPMDNQNKAKEDQILQQPDATLGKFYK